MEFHRILHELNLTAIRSRGPGGQNVNKVSSAAALFWDFQKSAGLTDEEKETIRQKLANIINKEGFLYLRSDELRDLERNKQRCREKLQVYLIQALHKKKKRKPTRPTKASKERKLQAKSRRSEIKKLRRKEW